MSHPATPLCCQGALPACCLQGAPDGCVWFAPAAPGWASQGLSTLSTLCGLAILPASTCFNHPCSNATRLTDQTTNLSTVQRSCKLACFTFLFNFPQAYTTLFCSLASDAWRCLELHIHGADKHGSGFPRAAWKHGTVSSRPGACGREL